MADPNKWALLVGINDYPNIFKLAGPVNDVLLMGDILQSGFGFPPDQTRFLFDAQATREGMLDAIDWLSERIRDDDIVVFFFSGQGAQLPDPTGKWPSGKVSTLVPYDVGSDGNGQLMYDELCERLMIQTAARPYLTLILDTNHAGTIGPCLDADSQLRERTVFLGACRTDESAYETYLEGLVHGAFTYALGQTLVTAGPEATYRQVFKQVSSQVLARFPQQHPQMEGEGDRPLFGVSTGAAMRFVRVIDRSRFTLTLGAGAAHGMTSGSTWAIYPPDTLQVTSDTSKEGLVEITSVGAVESAANILSEAGAEAITAGAKAIEETHHYGEMRLIVDMRVPDEKLFERLRQLFEESDLLRVAQPQEHANITVWLVEPRSKVLERDPVPQLGALDVTTWALVDESDRLIGPTYPVGDSSAVWNLRDNLERLARTHNILNLRNPDMNSPLVGKVDFALERQLSDGTWVKPEVQSGLVVLEEGDRIRFAINNRYQAPLYISLLDFPWDGSFSLIFPSVGSIEDLEPGERVETPALEVFVPDELFQRAGGDNEPPTADVEIVKMFATTYPTDFGALVQQESMRGIRSSMGEATILWELLDMALTGYGSRRSRSLKPPAEQNWITVEHSFAVRRRQGGSHD